MITFKEFLKESMDDYSNNCVAIALHHVSGIDYDKVHEIAVKIGNWNEKQGVMGYKIADIANALGLEIKEIYLPIRKDPKTWNYLRKTVGWFVKTHPKGTYIVKTNGHAFAVIDGHVIDPNHTGMKTEIKGSILEIIKKT